jgi:hypothetical protein
MWVPYQQAFHPGWSGQKSAFDRISRPIQDRLAPRRSGQGYQTRPVRPVAVTGQTGAARKAAPPSVRQVYKPKQREEVKKMEVDPERTTCQDIIQIGSMDVSIGEDGKRPIVPNNKVVTSTPEVTANDHEAGGSSSNSKYFLPRWCPPGLTRTQRRKLQRLRFQEKREKELEKKRDEAFN